jgi:hypothetical protein
MSSLREFLKPRLEVTLIAAVVLQSCSSGEKPMASSQPGPLNSPVASKQQPASTQASKQNLQDDHDDEKSWNGDYVHSPIAPSADGVLDGRVELAALIHRHPKRLNLLVMRYYDKLTKEELSEFKTQEAIDTIKNLDMARMGLNDDEFEAICGLKNLVSLNVRGNPVRDLHFIKPLRNLKYLDISDTHIGGDGMKAISEMPLLERVTAINAHVDEDAWQYAGGCPKLKELYIQGVQIKPATLKKLRKNLPDCSVVTAK